MNKKTKSDDQLKSFGVVMTIALLVLTLIIAYKRQVFGYLPFTLLVASFLMLFLSFFFPRVLSGPEKAWMFLGEKIGIIVTFVVLVLSYFTVFTFVGFLLKLLRKDILELKIDKKKNTYWTNVVRDESREKTRYFLPY